MTIKFLSQGWEDYLYWQQTDKAILQSPYSLTDQ
ncbi:MAG: type II toxin-antitoxin system YoeB family toxin [Phycisphaerales bacterium]|nr:type II toxin-antitoxin system YoeB family toxin [Phycisphaerales bacterium]